MRVRKLLGSLVVLVASNAYAFSSDSCLIDHWRFSANSQVPSVTLDGQMNIVFDSASYVIGAFRISKRILPFHGRFLDGRLIARTDPKFEPVLRLDCTLDTVQHTLSGVMQVSVIRGKEPKKKAKDYHDVMFDVYVIKE